jgi:hypothetical protein
MLNGNGVSHWKTYLQAVILILVSVGLVLIGYGLSGCFFGFFGFGRSSYDVFQNPGPREALNVQITSGGDSPNNPVSPGDRVTRTIRVAMDQADPSDVVKITFYTSSIATNIDFGGYEASYNSILEAYILNDVPLNTDIVISYDVSTQIPAFLDNTFDTVTAELFNEVRHTGSASYKSEVNSRPDNRVNQNRPVGGSKGMADDQTASRDNLALEEDYYLWEIGGWYFIDDQKMTPEFCQQWFDFWQSGNAYLALRFPELGATPAYTDSYSLPAVFRGAYSPTVSLVDNSDHLFTKVITTPMTYRPEVFEFLANELPAVDGEHWIALDVPTTPKATCPGTLDIPAGDWTFYISFALDFGGLPESCEECVLPLYYCYESEGPALAHPLVTGVLGERGLEPAYQGLGTTCFGPQPIRLRDWSSPDTPDTSFEFHDTNFDYITTTQTISFPHRLWNLGMDPVTVSFDFTSTLGLPWVIYSGTVSGPTAPLEGPLTLVEPYVTKRIWMVADVPDGTQGMEALSIKATDVTSSTLSMQTSDLLWIGEWVEPPGKPDYRLYLPLVVK